MTMGVNRAIHSKRKRRHGTFHYKQQNDAGGPTRAIYGGRAPGRRRAKRITKRRRR
jgi:hypothetical protein